MNKEKVEGKFDQAAGKVKQKVGEAIGSEKLVNAGVAEQIKGAAKETWGHAKDAAKETRDTQIEAEGTGLKSRTELAAHDMREKVASTAHNVKEKINHKLDDIQATINIKSARLRGKFTRVFALVGCSPR